METRVKLKYGIILVFVIFLNCMDICNGADDNVTTTTATVPTTDHCVGNECKNSAPCVNGDGNYTCNCTDGWEGWLCDMDIDDCMPDPCKNNGVCSDNGTNSFMCNCTSGWTGDTCTEDIDDCKPDLCKNNGVCSDNGTNSFMCNCTMGWTGDTCTEDKDDCMPDPCKNNGVCSDNGTNSFICNCTIGWTGDTCTEDINECKDDPCINGTCLQANGTGNFSCACLPDYKGELCDTVINDCDPDPCKNGGNCTDGVGNYTCACPSGFQGMNCEQDVLECAENPCENGGYCQEKYGNYKCLCTNNWSGTNCTEDFNECTMECQGQGFNCTNMNGSYLCECSQGYIKLDDMCIEIVMIEDKAESMIRPITMANTVHRINTPPIPYYGQLYHSLFVSTNGYVTFGERFEQNYPPLNLSDWSDSSKYKILAPYWWMNDIPDSMNSKVAISEYSSELVSDGDDLEMFSQIIKDGVSETTFTAEYVVMVTWHEFTPFPAAINKDKLSITYQLVYITDGKQGYAVINYGKLWPHSPDRSVASILTGPTTEEIKNIEPEENKRQIMSLYENNEMVDNPDFDCRKHLAQYTTYYQQMSHQGMNHIQDPGTCPCTLSQAKLDLQYEMDSEHTTPGQECYKQVFYQENKEKQICCFNIQSESLNVVQPGHGYGMPQNTTIADLVNNSRTVCCGDKSNSCSMFTKMVTRSSCNNYDVKAGIIFGDPHLRSLHRNFIFNGHGEYVLFKSQQHNMPLDVQVRTDLVKVTGGEMGKATQIVALAVKYHNTGNLEFMMKSTNLKFYVNGMEQTDNIMNENMMVKKMGTDYAIILHNGQSLKIHPTMDHLTLTLFGKFDGTQGLLGVANDNMADYFTFSNGTMIPHNATEEEVFEFGQSWLVAMEDDSLFNYTLIDGNFSTNQYPDFTPEFYGDKIDNKTILFDGNEDLMNVAVTRCRDHVACLVDYAATKNGTFAETTKMIDEKFMADKMKLENNPPTYKVENYLRNLTYAKYGDNFEMKFEFMDSTEFNVTIETNLADGTWSLSDENVFSANSTSITSDFYVRAIAENIHGMKSVNQPLLRFCFCQSLDNQCIQNGDNIIDKCDCPSNRTGEYCETEVVDVCNKCFDKALCNVSNTESPCACPEGLMGDGLNCYDVDECLTGSNMCDQECNNTIGNYTCSCRHGYELSGMGTCTDIDECSKTGLNNCTASEYCINEPGGFTCPCRTMFKRDENNLCVEVVALYGGRVVFASVPGSQTWTPQLEDKRSTEFKELSMKVEKSIKETLEKNPDLKTNLMTISVVKFMMKSGSEGSRKKRAVEPTQIEAEYEAAFSEEIPETTLKDSLNQGFKDCTATGCTFGTLIGVVKNSTTLSSNYDLCETDNNICQQISTTCQSSSGTYTCSCRQGYEKWNQFTQACQDINECEVTVNNKTALQEMCGNQGLECINEPGTYSCRCTSDYTYQKDTKCTLTNYCNSEPCKNGAKCENVWGDAKYACKCNYGWTGVNCQDRDEEAERQRIIIIAVSATLGVICFILLLVLVLICTKRKQKSHHASMNMEEYASFKGIPRASLHGQDNPMMENETNRGRANHYV